MLASNRIVLAALVLLPLAGGCGSKFAGEWVQESVVMRDGTVTPAPAARRLALQFTPPSSVRVGFYSDSSGVVEDDTVSSSDYQTMQNRTVAQFGAYTARVQDGQLITFVGAEEKGRFRRHTGESVFPPIVKLPQIAGAGPSIDAVMAASAPADAVVNEPRPTAPELAVAK